MEVVERVRQLIEVMADNDLAELEVEEPELRIKITKSHAPQAPATPFAYGLPPLQQPPGTYPALPQVASGDEEPTAEKEGLIEITSPMVGTFYRSSSPGGDPYVSIGTDVDADTVVCIIEAMKVMNEIKAEVTGRIAEVLVEDAEPIEYGQVLFLVEPTDD
jgi:acetyl-CoA carboxylase biotin carboxyl carrier protein